MCGILATMNTNIYMRSTYSTAYVASYHTHCIACGLLVTCDDDILHYQYQSHLLLISDHNIHIVPSNHEIQDQMVCKL